ncbi:MAG TPA: M1 family aminopeptidase [Candidatus Angelobacter sp.]|nr:M1 family aminopeptidase [Candidatus Angelobacter sp.]
MLRRIAIALIFACAGMLGAQTLETRPAQPAITPTAPRAMANNEATYLKLRNIKLGTETVHVSNFKLAREAGVFTFRSGTFYFVEPVNGKITGAVFLGDGDFTLTPPIDIEKRNLAILTKGQPFDEQFSGAILRFTDGSEEAIRKAGATDNSPASGDAAGLLADVQQQLKKKLRENLSSRLLQDVLSSQPGGKFTAFIKGKRYSDKIVYDIDPHGAVGVSPEEVSLLLWDDSHDGVWSGFHKLAEYKNGTANSDEDNRTVAVEHQKLETSIAKSAYLTGTAETKFVALQDGVRVVPLDLYPTLRVDSVNGQGGEPLSFIQEDKDNDPAFSVILPKELKKGEAYTITTKYGGKDAISNEGGGNYYPIARSNWYPGQGFGNYATYDMTFRVPKGMTMVATGKLLKKIDEGNETITEWTSEIPQTVAGFNFGNFKREEGKPFKQPYLLETFANPNPPDVVAGLQHIEDMPSLDGNRISLASTLGTMSTLGMMKKAMAEAQLSIEIYTDYFGEAPYNRLAMTQQTAGNFGQSWPGLVYLPITYFFDSTVRHQLGMSDAVGYFKVVGPHEIAHQWWGHMVGFNSYRDQWISEGFADMSASIFLQYIYGQKNLDDYHKFWADERRLLTEKNRLGNRPIDVGSVTMGFRLNNAKTGVDIYRRLLYPKGAYILQMVRFMMTQRNGDPDARFKAMMHDFTKTYANRQASTEDFKAMVEKYMTPEMDIDKNHTMDWFFNEYVYGTEYPTYNFEHSFTTDANGDTVLNFKITQSGVSKDFSMLVPIYLDLGNRVVRLGAATLTGDNSVETHVPLKGLKEKPKRAVAAYYDDVLGDVENR